MEIRGERECKDCGRRWSYYETGSVNCPDCESMRSVGVDDEKRLHTASPVEFDLSEARGAIDEVPEDEALTLVVEACREFRGAHGFVNAGELQDLDDTYLVAGELRHVAGMVERSLGRDDEERFYLLSLLREDVTDRPAPDEVPETLRAARGLAYADSVRTYRRELRDWMEASGIEADRLAAEVLSALDDHAKRVEALDGDVSPRESERLVLATREVAAYLRDDDEDAISRARQRLDID
ncbi:DUF7117 family protein [Haloarchaeobius sp. TZWWS8]|uniref:DUF7117 family protein n=1 Tax=Haloarchaeobius sp. TZWWS8 TaxID=3446121 RepID=UPI003EB7B41E